MEEKNGLRTHYGFYASNEQLGLPTRNEEELIEYKRLIGMPLTEDYEELMDSLVTPRLVCARPKFSDYDFIRLFIALIYKKGQIFFDRNMLRYQLYEFHSMEEYQQLFEDIAVKQQIEGNFLDIEEALQNAALYGLINSFDSQPIGNKRLIHIDKDYCEKILSSYSDEYVIKMDSLTDAYLKKMLLVKSKTKKL